MLIRDILKDTAARYKDKPALIYKGNEVSFTALEAQVVKLANALKRLGVNKGDKIGMYLPNCPQFACTYLACFSLGAVGVPLDFMLKGDELVSCLSHAEVKVLVAMTRKGVNLSEVCKQLKTCEHTILCSGQMDGAVSYDKLLSESPCELKKCDIDEDDPALIMYTSGTTGKPKGIRLNYKHLNGSPLAMEHFVDLSDKDVKLAAIPLSHIGGFIYLQNSIYFGITVILMDRFNPFEFLEHISRYKVTCFHIVPPMYNAILTVKELDKFDLSSLRWVVVFGAPSSPEILQRFHKYCPNARLLNGWGMTETCPPNTVTPLDSDKIESVGKPSPLCTIKIVDDNDRELPPGEIGEIVIDGWIVMDSYYKDEEATQAVKKKNGLHTGDLGRFDGDGFLYIVGRKKEMIKVAGQIVYAPEVESALYKNEDVLEAAVIGVPDKLKGEAVKAFVVLKEGAGISSEDLRAFAREHLANFKVPQTIEIKSDLPKNRTGKIDKQLLKEGAVAGS